VHAPDAVVDDARTCVGEPFAATPHHLGAEPVVSEEDVANAGYQNPGRDVTPISLHAADFHVTPDVRNGRQAKHDAREHHDSDYTNGHPTHYVHCELLSVSGSTSSGAKYR
jgi:hypothetical protein